MRVILFTVLGGLILLWAGVLALLKWIDPIERKHLLWLGGYLSLVSCLLIFLVIHTSSTQQKAALDDTREMLAEQVGNFRIRLGEITERLMGQIEEKAELTGSEMEVRGNLKQERAEHAATRQRLAETASDRDREHLAHFAYRDSLHTERFVRIKTERALADERSAHRKTQGHLDATSDKLAASEAITKRREKDLTSLKKNLDRAQQRVENAEKDVLNRLRKQASQMGAHIESFILLQSSIDTIYQKVMRRPRVPPITP